MLFNCPSPSPGLIHPWFRWELLHTPLSAVFSVTPQDWEVLVLEKLKWDLVSVIANDFLAHILHHLPLPKDKMELVKKHAQTFIALCATGGCLLLLGPSAGGWAVVPGGALGCWMPTCTGIGALCCSVMCFLSLRKQGNGPGGC